MKPTSLDLEAVSKAFAKYTSRKAKLRKYRKDVVALLGRLDKEIRILERTEKKLKQPKSQTLPYCRNIMRN
jgi:hypothetical protein